MKLTKRAIDGLKPDASGRDVFVWDDELKGFGVRIKPSGAAAYLIQYKTPQRKTRRLAFGKVTILTPEEARAKARKLLAEVADGADPSSDRHANRSALTIAVDLPRFRGEAWCWVSVTDVRLRRRPPCRCSSFVRPQRSPFLHPGPCAGSAAAHSPCQARAFCAPARACA